VSWRYATAGVTAEAMVDDYGFVIDDGRFARDVTR
jgi:hypothetical protein